MPAPAAAHAVVPVARPARAPARGYRDDVSRAGFVVSGVAAAVLGGALLAGGVVVGLTFGPDGTVTTEPTRVRAAGVALLVDGLQVDAVGLPLPEGVGVLTLSATSTDGAPLFLGVANGSDLDAYLAGAPYDVVAQLATGGAATTRTVPGTQQPPPPSAQQFWLRQDEGSPGELAARIPQGTTVVLMRSDATPAFDADLAVTLEVDRAWPSALVLGGVGVVLLALAVALLVAGVRRRPQAPVGAHSPSAGATVLPGAAPPALGSPAPDDATPTDVATGG